MILKKHLIQIENPHGLVPTCMTAKIMRCSHESGMNEAVYCLPGSSCGRGLKPPLESGFKQMQFLCADSTGAGKRGVVLPYMGYIGMCRCERYGFQAVYSGIGYINQSVWL